MIKEAAFPENPLSPEVEAQWEAVSNSAIDRFRSILQSPEGPQINRLVRASVRQPDLPSASDIGYKIHKLVDPVGTFPTDTIQEDPETFVAQALFEAAANAYLIDALKIDELGIEADPLMSNRIVTSTNDVLAIDTVATLAKHGVEPSQLVTIARSVIGTAQSQLRVHPSPTVAWLFPKIESFGSALHNAALVTEYAASNDKKQYDGKEIKARASENNQLFLQTKALQKYGLKTAIAPSQGNGNTNEWLLFDSNTMNEELGGIRHKNFTHASVLGARTKFISGKPEVSQMKSTTFEGVRSVGIFTDSLVEEQDDVSMSLSIGLDGQLVTSGALMSLQPLFKRLGRIGEYEELRSELLSIYFDLVTPVYVQEIIQQEAAAMRSSNPDFDGLRRLVIARTRVLNVLKDDITEVLENEEDVPRGYANGLARHDVIQHIRALPKGYRASDAARRACFEDLGIVLAEDGETYVRPHKRGSIENKAKGHKVTYDIGAMATKQSTN